MRPGAIEHPGAGRAVRAGGVPGGAEASARAGVDARPLCIPAVRGPGPPAAADTNGRLASAAGGLGAADCGGLRRGGGEGSGPRVRGTVGVEREESLGSGRGPGGRGSGARRAVVGCRRAWEKDGGSGRGAVLELGQGAAGPWGGGGENRAGGRGGGGAPKEAGPELRGPASAASPPPKVTAVNKGHALCTPPSSGPVPHPCRAILGLWMCGGEMSEQSEG